MHITLINPPYKKEEVFSFLSDSAPVLPTLGLAYLASYLKKHSFSVNIVDAHALGLNLEEAAKMCISSNPGLIGINANSPLYSRVLELGDKIKELFPSCPIALGGYHPTFLGEEVLKHGFVDFVIRGEGEETLLELAKAIQSGGDYRLIKGLGFKCEGRPVLNPDRGFIEDLDKLPFPAYDLLPMEKYHIGNNLHKAKNSISVIASRGCTGSCFFCTSPGFWKMRHRKHSPGYILSLMNYLHERFGKKHFQFRDDTFTLDKTWILNFCALLNDNKYKFSWDCYSRFDAFDEEMLISMKKAGCNQLSLGVESANDQVLRAVKGFSREKACGGMELLKKHRFKTRLFFMIGPPVTSAKDINDIADFAIRLSPDVLVITASIPYPGSLFYDTLKEKGRKIDFSKAIPRVYEGFCDFDGLSKEHIKRNVARVYRKFYLRPSFIIKTLISIRSLSGFCVLCAGGISLIREKMRFPADNMARYRKYIRFARKKPSLMLIAVKRIIDARLFKKQVLRKLELSVTYDCQCKCIKCSSSKLKSPLPKELSLDEIRKISRQAYALGVFQVNLIGGEPLLRKDLGEIIKCFKANRTFLSISTNGALLTGEKIRELKMAGIDYIKISLDSPIGAEHDQKRGLPGLFEVIMRAVELIKAEGLLCELSTVVTQENITSGKIWELVELAKKKDVILGLVIPAVCGGWSRSYDVLLGPEHKKVLDELVKYPHVVRDTQTGLSCSQCSAGKEQAYVTAYGDVLPCSVVQISFGNIRQESLEASWAKMQGSGMFEPSKNLCLAGEDKEFIDNYLKPISCFEQMPVALEELKNKKT